MSEWKTKPLGDLAENISRPFNFNGKKEVIFINTGDVLEGKFLHADYSPVAGLPGQAKKAIKKGDILYSEIRPGNKRYVFVDFDVDNYVVSTKFMVVRATADISPEFLYMILTGKACEQEFKIIADSRSGTFPQITFDSVAYYPISFPKEKEQDRLVEISSSLNDKIELNRQTNETLEQIAQAIFKSWFVDFEPVKAKIKAKQSLSPALTQSEREQIVERAAMCAISGKTDAQLDQLDADTQQQLKTTAALFPEALVDSELGEIPDGWEGSTLGEHFNVVMGQSPKGDTYNEDGNGMLFYQGRRDFGFRYPTPRVYTTDPKRLAQAGDTLISVRAPVGDRNMANQECCLGRGVAGIRHKSGARSFTYAFIGHIEKSLSDSGSDGTVFSSINKNELSGVGFIAPSDSLLSLFEENIEIIDQRIEVNSAEINTLEILRNTLLPKLLSGELSTQAIKATLSEAVK